MVALDCALLLIVAVGCSSRAASSAAMQDAAQSEQNTATRRPIPSATPAPSPTPSPTPGPGLEKLLEDASQLSDSDASQALDEIIDLYPEQGAGYFARAVLYARLGDGEAALTDYQAGLALDPANKQAQNAMIDLLQGEDRHAQLKDALDQLIDAVPNDIELYVQRATISAMLGDVDVALVDLQQVQEVLAENSEPVWVNAASTFYSMGDYENTLLLTGGGLKHLPESNDLLLLGGTAALALGDNEAALDLFGQLVEVDPQDFRAWHRRGVAHMLLGDSEAAIADLEHAIAIGEEAGVAGNSEAFEAMADLGNVFAADDVQAGLVYLNQQETYYVLNYGVRPRALMAGRARVYTTTDQFDAALELLGRAIQRGYIEGHYYRAVVWEQLGEVEKASSDLQTYVDARPVGQVSEWARDLLVQLETS